MSLAALLPLLSFRAGERDDRERTILLGVPAGKACLPAAGGGQKSGDRRRCQRVTARSRRKNECSGKLLGGSVRQMVETGVAVGDLRGRWRDRWRDGWRYRWGGRRASELVTVLLESALAEGKGGEGD